MFNLIKFFFSIRFLKHFLLGILFCFIFFVLIFFTLQFITNHNDKIKVPNLESLNLSQVSKELNEIKLRFEVLDSSKYNPNYGPLTVIEHSPKFNQIVKRNRKIYLTINPSTYRQLKVPNIIKNHFDNSLRASKYFLFVYYAMVAEENKKGSKLGKRIKLLGVYQVLIEGMNPLEASNFSKGLKWITISNHCRKRGF